MLRRDQSWPSTDGGMVDLLRAELTAWSDGLTVGRKRPQTMTRRVITVRNDGGPSAGKLSLRRYGVNVWADNDLTNNSGDPAKKAEELALKCMSILSPVVDPDSFTGPFEVEDDPAYVVNGKQLGHYYFTFGLSVRAVQN